jgi:GNAT superfamily N-acetyltransferase
LTESVLKRLTTEAFVSFLGQSDNFEAILRPGADLVICNEPVADLNCVVAGSGAANNDYFREACQVCLSKDLPFLAIVFPEAGDQAQEVAAEVGLVLAVEFPFMVREDLPIEPSGNDAVGVEIETGSGESLNGMGAVSAAFRMPLESTRRVLRPSLVDSPAMDIYYATLEGRTVGSVTLSHHGDTSGIWAMGTDPDSQGQGVGRRLLSTALAQSRDKGSRRFFLGATPAGYPLYEKLGFETRVVASVWVSGETSQA